MSNISALLWPLTLRDVWYNTLTKVPALNPVGQVDDVTGHSRFSCPHESTCLKQTNSVEVFSPACFNVCMRQMWAQIRTQTRTTFCEILPEPEDHEVHVLKIYLANARGITPCHTTLS